MPINTSLPADQPDIDEMKVIHKALDREFTLLPGIIAAVAEGDRPTAAVVRKHAQLVLAMLHEHHESEDEYLWPLLHQRVTVDQAVIDDMEEQHKQLATIISGIELRLPDWSRTAGSSDRDLLHEQFSRLSRALREHLAQEEAHVLPLVEQHLSVAEWKAPQAAAMRNLPSAFTARMLLAGVVLEDATPAEHRWFLHEMPPPARVLWRFFGTRLYARHTRAVRAPLARSSPAPGS